MAGELTKGRVYNHDCAALSQMWFRICNEVYKSVSASTEFVNEHDFKRWRSYLDWLSDKIDWIAARPQMDLPESHPEPFLVDEPKQWALVESEACNDFLRLGYISLVELHNCQSARAASGLSAHDLSRCKDLIQKLYDFLDNFVKGTSPMDLPESSPQRESSGKGKLGT